MAERFAEMSQRIEAQEQLMQEQQRNIEELKAMLVKVVENTQKNTEDGAGDSSFSDKVKKDETKSNSDAERKGGEDRFVIDHNTDKIEKLQS